MFNTQFNAGPSRQAIRNALARLEDMTPLFRDITEHMIRATRERFAKGVAPDGSAWPAKSQATLDRYRRLGYGSLVRPLIGPSRRLGREIVGQPGPNRTIIGSALIYSGVMQQGAARGAFGTDRHGRPIPWGRIPARVWLGISREDDAAIAAMADRHAERALES